MIARNFKTGLSIFGVVLSGAALTAFELIGDDEKFSAFEFAFDSLEKSLIVTGVVGVFYLLKNSKKQEEERIALVNELEVARVEGQEWRGKVQTFVEGFGAEVEKQFSIWNLSDAETDVGLLMIKGLSHKEIAELRGTAEATVRQQARSIYSKSGLPSKAAFSAYFLEDLLPPSAAENYSNGKRAAVA